VLWKKAGIALKSLKNLIELDSSEAIKSAVEAGLGIRFISRWAIAKELELRALKVVEVSGMKVARHFSLALYTGPEPPIPMRAR